MEPGPRVTSIFISAPEAAPDAAPGIVATIGAEGNAILPELWLALENVLQIRHLQTPIAEETAGDEVR
jgi:hypothetical protein